jgi:hypothetical protein
VLAGFNSSSTLAGKQTSKASRATAGMCSTLATSERHMPRLSGHVTNWGGGSEGRLHEAACCGLGTLLSGRGKTSRALHHDGVAD